MSDQITPDRGRNRYDNHSTDHFYTRHRPNNEKRYPRPSGSERFYVPQESFYGSDTYRPLYEPARPSSSKSSRPGTPISRKREMGKSSPDQINTRESTGSGSNPHYKNRWTDRPRDSSDDPAKISSSLNGVGKSLNCNNRPANGNGDNQSEPHTAPKLNLKSVPEQISLESRKSLPHEESYTRSSLAMGAYSYVEKYDSTGVHMQENGHPTMSFQPFYRKHAETTPNQNSSAGISAPGDISRDHRIPSSNCHRDTSPSATSVVSMSSGSTPFSSRRNQCRICKRPETPVIKPIVRCNNCHGGYHTYCHNPKIDFKQINAAWICYKCTKKLKRGPRRSDILKEAQVEISSNENNGSSIQRNANKSTAFVGNNTLMNCETLSSSGLATRAINFEVVIETRRSTPGASDPECSQQPQNLPMPTTVKDYQDTIIGPHSSIDTYMPISALCDDNQGVAISGFSEGALQGSIKPVQSILPSEVRNSQEEVEHSLSEAPMSIDSSSPTSPRMTEHHDAQPNHYSKDNFLNNRSKSSSPYSPPPAESTGNEDVWKSSRMSRSNCRICGVPGQDASASMICINCQSRELNPEEIQSSHIGQNGSKNARRDSKESCIRSYDHQKMKISTENLAVPKTEPSSQSLQRVRTSKEIVAERYNMKHIPFDPHAHMRQLAASSGTMAARKNAPRVPQPSVRRSHKYEPGRGSITPIAADNSSGINKQTRSSSTPSTAKKNSRKRGPALKNAGKLTRRRSVSTSSDLDIEDDEFAQRIKDQKGYTKKQMERGAQLERELREERRELREERRRADRAIRGKTIAEKQLYQVIKEKAALEKSINESRQNGRGREGEDLNVEHLMDVDDPPQNAPKGISMREVYKDHVFNNISPWGDRARTPSPKGKKPIQRPEKSDYVPWDRSKLMNIHIHRQTDRQRKPCIGIVPQVEVAASGDDEECSPYIMHSQRISFDEFMGIPQNMVPAVKDGKLSFRAGAINPRYRTLDRNVPFYKLRFLGDLY